jgi:hypothetical protein
MKKILSLLVLLFTHCVYGQEPTLLSLKLYGGNGSEGFGNPVIKTSDGGFIIGIGSNSTGTIGNIDTFCAENGNRTIFLKYNSDATILEWTKCFSYSTGDTSLDFMFPQNDGGAVIGGLYNSTIGWGFYICRHDAADNILWAHGYSIGLSAIPKDMIATSDGGYIIVGGVYYSDTNFTVHNSGSFHADIGVLKLDSLGNKIWSKAIGGTLDEASAKVLESQGGYYIVGRTNSDDSDCTGYHGGGNDVYIVRLDLNGNILWHHDLGGSSVETGDYACLDGNGGVLIAATSNSSDGDVMQ